MAKQSTLKVPVIYQRGGMLHDTNYARGAQSRQEAAQNWADDMAKHGHNRWSVNYVMEVLPNFRARMRVTGYYKNRSAANMVVTDEQGQKWPMFLGDLAELLESANMENGWIEENEYEAIKRGTAYGIRKVK